MIGLHLIGIQLDWIEKPMIELFGWFGSDWIANSEIDFGLNADDLKTTGLEPTNTPICMYLDLSQNLLYDYYQYSVSSLMRKQLSVIKIFIEIALVDAWHA